MEYRKEESSNDRRSIPRLGENQTLDRRNSKEYKPEQEGHEISPNSPTDSSSQVLSSTEKVKKKHHEITSDELKSLFANISKQIKNELKEELINLNSNKNDSENKYIENDLIARRPGRPSSLPSLKESDEWPRKTYRFNKKRIKELKDYQNSLEPPKDLAILIDEALQLYLKNKNQ